MKPLYASILFLCGLIANAQLQVHTLTLKSNDLVYDSVNNKLYASIPSSNGSHGNSIGRINPQTFALENTTFMGSEPGELAISDNNQYIYAGFGGAAIVRRFNIGTQSAEIQFPLGSDSFSGPFYAYDIDVMPGQPETVAVSRRVNNSTGFYGTAIYDNGVVRPINTNTQYPNDDPYVIRFVDAATMYGFNNHSTGFDFTKLLVNSQGVSESTSIGSVAYNFNIENFVYNGNFVYFDYGTILDKSFEPAIAVGQFTGANGRVVYDHINNLVCFATFDFSGNIVFKRYNPNTFLLYDSIPITQAAGDVESISLCGNGCYAFNTEDGKIVFVTNGAVLGTPNVQTDNLKIYPNPSSDIVYIDTPNPLARIELYDMYGHSIKISGNTGELNLTQLSDGVYTAVFTAENEQKYVRKIVKN